MPNRVPSQVMPDDVDEHRAAACAACRRIAGRADVALDGVEEPQRRVGGVIQALARAVGEHVRDQAVADVVRERAQDVAGLALPAVSRASAPRG